MNNSRRNNAARNKEAKPQTQAEFYEQAWNALFNKISKEEQQEILYSVKNNKSSKVFDKFVKNVVELGEKMSDGLSKEEPQEDISI